MKFYIKQHVFTWGDKFSVYDADGAVHYTVKGEVFSFGKHLHVYDARENEVANIHQRLFRLMPRYTVERGGCDVAEIVKKFTLFHLAYEVEGLGWSVTGDFFDHDYTISNENGTVATISKEWFTFGDAYAIDIAADTDEINALCVVLVIDAVLSANSN